MQIAYTSQNFTLKQRGHVRRSCSLLPWCQCASPILSPQMGTMGLGDGDCNIPWDKVYYYACFGVPNLGTMGFSPILGPKFHSKLSLFWMCMFTWTITPEEGSEVANIPLINYSYIYFFVYH
jgi:hypothetical protein